MIKKNSLLAILLLLLIMSCSTKNEEIETHDHAKEELVLDNGEKWTVVPKMMGFIRSMEMDVNNCKETSVEELKMKLSRNLDSLTFNCTMSGEAHDVLHLWLVPFMDNVDELDDKMTEEEVGARKKSLSEDFKTFNRYFE